MNNKRLGYSTGILSMFLMGSMGLYVRYIPVDGYTLTFARLGIGFLFLFLYQLLRGNIRTILKGRVSIYLFLSGAMMAANVLFYIQAMGTTSLSNAAFILYTAPILAVAIGFLVFGEKVSLFNMLLIFISFLGFLFLLQFKFDYTNSVGNVWALLAAICYALYIVFNKKIPSDVPSSKRSFYQFLFAGLITLTFLDSSFLDIKANTLIWIGFIGFLQGFIALTLLIVSIKNLSAVEYGTISYLEPLVASLIGYFVFFETFTIFQTIGSSIILTAGLILVIRDQKIISKKSV